MYVEAIPHLAQVAGTPQRAILTRRVESETLRVANIQRMDVIAEATACWMLIARVRVVDRHWKTLAACAGATSLHALAAWTAMRATTVANARQATTRSACTHVAPCWTARATACYRGTVKANVVDLPIETYVVFAVVTVVLVVVA